MTLRFEPECPQRNDLGAPQWLAFVDLGTLGLSDPFAEGVKRALTPALRPLARARLINHPQLHRMKPLPFPYLSAIGLWRDQLG